MNNGGEAGELLLKARVLLAMHKGESAGPIGKVVETNVGDLRSQGGLYRYPLERLPEQVSEVCEDPSLNSYHEIRDRLKSADVTKASNSLKADIRINDTYYSIKSSNEKPAVVNHTKRSGFLNATREAKCSIELLDNNVEKYWGLRLSGALGEDVGGAHRASHNLFWDSAFKEQFRAIFNYFAFDGTGRGISKIPAQMILEFGDPREPRTWRIHSKQSYYEDCWPKLVFSLRNHNQGALRPEDRIWARNCNGKNRGQLHIRVG